MHMINIIAAFYDKCEYDWNFLQMFTSPPIFFHIEGSESYIGST